MKFGKCRSRSVHFIICFAVTGREVNIIMAGIVSPDTGISEGASGAPGLYSMVYLYALKVSAHYCK